MVLKQTNNQVKLVYREFNKLNNCYPLVVTMIKWANFT